MAAKKRRDVPKEVPAEGATTEVEVRDQEEVADRAEPVEVEELPEEEPQEGEDAAIEVKVKGGAKAVRSAFSRMGGVQARPAPAPQQQDDDAVDEADAYQDEALELVAKLLVDPRNKVSVIRTYPRRVNGRNCAVQVDEYPCPTTIEQIERDVFERFGGESYNLMVHPNSPAGRHKILAAYPITHPSEKNPIFEDDEQQQEMAFDPRMPGQISDGSDPTAGEVDDPMALAENMMKRKAKLLHQTANLKQAERAVKSMEEEDRSQARQSDPVMRALEDRFDRQLGELKQLLMQQGQQSRPPVQDNTLLVELMRGNQAQFAAMMQAMQASQASTMTAMMQLNQGGKRDSVDDQLERLVKMKEAFGGDDSRVKRLEQMLFDAALDRIEGNGEGSSDEDPIKFGIKQLTPVLKGYLERAGNGKEVARDPAEVRRIYEEAAQKAAKELAAKWEAEGKIVRVPTPALPGPGPGPGAKPQQQPPPQQQPTEPQQEPPEGHDQEGDEMPTPPGPTAPGYDRKKAVDFVLSTVIEDIKGGCPQDSYAVGDCLDRLDDNILDQILAISTGADLEGLMRPWASAEKVDFIKEAGKDPTIKSYLTRVVVTVQDVYLRQTQRTNQAAPKKP
jgi:hypothetical protein